MSREDLVMGSSKLMRRATLAIYPEWEETGDMAAGSRILKVLGFLSCLGLL